MSFSKLNLNFSNFTKGIATKELPLFRALIKSFNCFPGSFSKELHGRCSQVKFKRKRKVGRKKVQCELADLLLIVVPKIKPENARLTFIQAKVTKKSRFHCSSPAKFKGNLEQWDLLGNRPLISGAYSNFNPPADLLSSAPVNSIGSFGVFYKTRRNGLHDLAYYSADVLHPLNNNQSKNGTLISHSKYQKIRTVNKIKEVESVCCLDLLARKLDMGIVGCPIKQLIMSGNPKPNPKKKEWLGGIFSTIEKKIPEASKVLKSVTEKLELSSGSDYSRIPSRAVAVLSVKGEK
jgi:hypothetical protein